MKYRCPLCLTELTAGMQFNRYCTTHEQLELVSLTDEGLADSDFMDTLFCPKSGCTANVYISQREGVFLSHVGCEALNPFWDAREQKVLSDFIEGIGEGDDNYWELKKTIDGKTATLKINHWEIGMLRTIGKRYADYPHMWFPPILVKAAAIRDDGKNAGSIVALVGGKRVGKTVLAIQAMNRRGYIKQADRDRRITLGGYMFSRLLKGRMLEDNPLFETLYLDYLLSKAESNNLFRLLATQRTPGDLKVVFIKPSPQSAASVVTNNSHQPFRKQWRSRSGLPGKVGLTVKYVFKDLILYSLKSSVTVGEPAKPEIAHSPWHTLTFYDVAGEDVEKGGSIVRKILNSSEKIAILVNASEVFDRRGGEESIQAAHRSIHDLMLMTSDKKRCLVVTQVDKILELLKSEEQEMIKGAAENLGASDEQARRQELKKIRAMLTKYLWSSGSAKKKEFADDLVEFGDIFFLWTENLPRLEGGAELVERLSKVQAPAQENEGKSGANVSKSVEQLVKEQAEAFERATGMPTAQNTAPVSPPPGPKKKGRSAPSKRPSKRPAPESYGLARFICWCLDQPWSNISQPSTESEAGES